ncbi:3-carboxy-cis,cis-mucoante lactonizing enzyme [Trichodelitschia bisporula]|uniref:3-carboxy-cis,cis-mucoante lactonizing enzyme n=1 Tax=Trichodelitschia bisporula TaxID=703511 RepID=A0A6G1HV68_9PEZI|nr:3-carboxy-cis,cis-mucoante lactonizing enzyme [Trichodelitschia bisporula]
MMRWLVAGALLAPAAADLHHMFVGSFRTPHIWALEYDTERNAIAEVGNFTAHAGHPWLSFSYDRGTLYAAERDGWSSYTVISPQELKFQSNLTINSRCDGQAQRHGTTSVVAEQKSPFNVYGSGRSPCGLVMSTRNDGSLERGIQNITYATNSRVHGMTMDTENAYLYTADQKGNGVWTHRINANTGLLDQGAMTPFPIADARPRRVVLHPKSRYLYLLLSKLNMVAVYSVKATPRGPSLRYTGMNYTLIPPNVNVTSYRGHEILLSADGNVLWASVRYRPDRDRDEDEEEGDEGDEGDDDEEETTSSRGSGGRPAASPPVNKLLAKLNPRQWGGWRPTGGAAPKPASAAAPVKLPPGFLTAILISNPDNDPGAPAAVPTVPGRSANAQPKGAGYPLAKIMQVSTSTSGGKSNAVMPAYWSNEYMALSDSEAGMVQVWRIEGLLNLPKDTEPSVVRPPPQAPPAPPAPPAPVNAPPPVNVPRPVNAPRPTTTITVPGQGWSMVQPEPDQPAWKPAAAPPSGGAWRGTWAEKAAAPVVHDFGVVSTLEYAPEVVEGSKEKRQLPAVFNVRAAIVSEWRAPRFVVGTGDPAAPRTEADKNRDRDDTFNPSKPIKFGRGCCANAVWTD